MTTDQIRDQLQALPPDLPDAPDRFDAVQGRVVRRRRRLAAVTAGAALALVLAGWGAAELLPLDTGGTTAPAGPDQHQGPGTEFSNRSPGTILGSEATGESTVRRGTGVQQVDLPAPPLPAGTDALRLRVTCQEEATLMWPFNGTTTGCPQAEAEVGATDLDSFPFTFLVPLTDAGQPFEVQVSGATPWELSVTPVSVDQIPYGVNARGQTYGVATPLVRPDLVEVRGEDLTAGYLDARSTEELVGLPPETLAELEAYRQVERETLRVPLYASDGLTLRGTYEIQAPVDGGP
ncbi:hypothetical protein [uncultured Serinicoccus sp.]|uniref:hypothetical protein n=1 Tax=uncultured Serinicoccus sp. TaxID=735514 RepID=UPI002632C5E0|nr:hypothetical protein [uncultured Serinicoccus sp.]